MTTVIAYDDRHTSQVGAGNFEKPDENSRESPAAMTRYPEDQKERTRRRIVRSAARSFRSKGYASSGVDSVMRGAGLTHGGFYAHFRSKQALFAEAVREAVRHSGEMIMPLLDAEEPAAWLCQFATAYLGPDHLRAVADGCPLPSLLPEIVRAPKAVRRAFHEAGTERVDLLVERFDALGAEKPRAEAFAMIAQLAGALAMARAMPDPEGADAILAASRDRCIERIMSFAR